MRERDLFGRLARGLLPEEASLVIVDDLTPEREEQLTADLLRERVGIDPDMVGPLVAAGQQPRHLARSPAHAAVGAGVRP